MGIRSKLPNSYLKYLDIYNLFIIILINQKWYFWVYIYQSVLIIITNKIWRLPSNAGIINSQIK